MDPRVKVIFEPASPFILKYSFTLYIFLRSHLKYTSYIPVSKVTEAGDEKDLLLVEKLDFTER